MQACGLVDDHVEGCHVKAAECRGHRSASPRTAARGAGRRHAARRLRRHPRLGRCAHRSGRHRAGPEHLDWSALELLRHGPAVGRAVVQDHRRVRLPRRPAGRPARQRAAEPVGVLPRFPVHRQGGHGRHGAAVLGGGGRAQRRARRVCRLRRDEGAAARRRAAGRPVGRDPPVRLPLGAGAADRLQREPRTAAAGPRDMVAAAAPLRLVGADRPGAGAHPPGRRTVRCGVLVHLVVRWRARGREPFPPGSRRRSSGSAC